MRKFNNLILLVFICWLICGFSYIPSKTSIHTRKQFAVTYGLFQPGNNWTTSSTVVNKEEATVFGRQIKVRFESYDFDFMDYRLGVDVQGIQDRDLLYSSVLAIAELTNNLWRRKKHRIISVASVGYSPRTTVIANDEQLQGISYKYGLSFEWAYAMFKTWSTKLSAGYQYQKLGEFPTTQIFDPSFMTIRGVEIDLGVNYVF